jgi:outer membrane protein
VLAWLPWVAPHPAAAAELAGRILSLKECIGIALQTNPAVEISAQNRLAAQEKVEEAKGGYYPTLKASSSYTYTTPADEKMGVSPDNFDTRLAIRQPLYDGGATANLVVGVRQNIKVQDYEVARTRLEIVLAVKSAFFEVMKRRDLLVVAKSSRVDAEKHLEQARGLYAEGVSPRADVIKVEVQVSSTGLEVIRAENAVLQALANLAAAMGLPASTDFAVTPAEAVPSVPAALPPLAETITQAQKGRPELRGIMARIAAAQTSIRQIESGFYPNLSLDAAVGQQESTYPPTDIKWSVGLTLGIPVFERLTTRSKRNQAVAALGALKATELQTMRGVELEVQQAWLAMKESLERRQVTGKAREQAEEDLRVSEGRYQEGVGNILEVLDAQAALTQAKTNEVVASYDIATAMAKLERATGAGLEEESK